VGEEGRKKERSREGKGREEKEGDFREGSESPPPPFHIPGSATAVIVTDEGSTCIIISLS